MQDGTHYIIGQDSVTRCQLLTRRLTGLAARLHSQPIKIHDAFTAGAQAWALSVQREQIIAATELRAITINSQYAFINGALVPVWKDGFTASCTWQAPLDCRPFLVGVFCKTAHWQLKCADKSAYFVCLSRSKPGYFLLPMSNSWGDGRICMGGDIDRDTRRETLVGACSAYLTCFQGAPWVSDLIPNYGDGLFRFTPDTLAQIEPARDWTAYCKTTSAALLEDAPLPSSTEQETNEIDATALWNAIGNSVTA